MKTTTHSLQNTPPLATASVASAAPAAWTCAAAAKPGFQVPCTAPADKRHRCGRCSHTVCDVCQAPHNCSHDDRRRVRADGLGHFGLCNHPNVCSSCHGHGIHADHCSFRRANTSNAKAEKKRLEQRVKAIAAVDQALELLPRLRAALVDTDINERVLETLIAAMPNGVIARTLTALTGDATAGQADGATSSEAA